VYEYNINQPAPWQNFFDLSYNLTYGENLDYKKVGNEERLIIILFSAPHVGMPISY